MSLTHLTRNITTQFTLVNQLDPVQGHADHPNACLIVPIYQGNALSDTAQQLDKASQQALTKALNVGNFNGKAGQIILLYSLAGVNAESIMLVGCGLADEFDAIQLDKVAKKVAAELKKHALNHAISFLNADINDGIQRLVMTITHETYQFEHYKSEKSKYTLDNFVIVSQGSEQELTLGLARSSGRYVTRDLANHPGNVCTPTYLADHAKALADQCDKLSFEVLEEADMEKLGMGAFLSVSKGSVQPGKMILLNYQGGKEDEQPVVLVGKGITFDTGGISLKPGANMDEMKFDMGGAAGALGTMHALCAMDLAINVVMVVAAAENMPSGIATRPGDIVTAMSGKTIEVLNTDAEGRLVLCDALTYVKRYNPSIVIDMATLTGACIVALGHHISGMLSNNDELAEQLLAAGRYSDDEVWRLPMNKKYEKQLKSECADMGNIGGPSAGTITAACFLGHFTQDYHWAHLDIAGTAWKAKASTGRPVPLLTQLLLDRANA